MLAAGVPKFPTSPERYMFAEGGRVKVGGDKVDDSYQYRLATVNAGNGDKKVMVKIVDLEKSDDDGMLDVVQKEVAVMRSCKHKNIVQLYSSFVHNVEIWMVLDYMDCGSMGDQLRAPNHGFQGGFPEKDIMWVVKEALEGIAYFHHQGMIHRDIKADNILVDNNFNVKLTDFWDFSIKKNAMTFVGTPLWMAPEVIEQESGYDVKADIWSLGITVLQMAHGKAPYDGQKPLKVLKSILNLDPPELKGDFSDQMHELARACLQKDPQARKSADDLANMPGVKNAIRPNGDKLAVLEMMAEQERAMVMSGDGGSGEEWIFPDVANLNELPESTLEMPISELKNLSASDNAESVFSSFSGELETDRRQRRNSLSCPLAGEDLSALYGLTLPPTGAAAPDAAAAAAAAPAAGSTPAAPAAAPLNGVVAAALGGEPALQHATATLQNSLSNSSLDPPASAQADTASTASTSMTGSASRDGLAGAELKADAFAPQEAAGDGKLSASEVAVLTSDGASESAPADANGVSHPRPARRAVSFSDQDPTDPVASLIGTSLGAASPPSVGEEETAPASAAAADAADAPVAAASEVGADALGELDALSATPPSSGQSRRLSDGSKKDDVWSELEKLINEPEPSSPAKVGKPEEPTPDAAAAVDATPLEADNDGARQVTSTGRAPDCAGEREVASNPSGEAAPILRKLSTHSEGRVGDNGIAGALQGATASARRNSQPPLNSVPGGSPSAEGSAGAAGTGAPDGEGRQPKKNFSISDAPAQNPAQSTVPASSGGDGADGAAPGAPSGGGAGAAMPAAAPKPSAHNYANPPAQPCAGAPAAGAAAGGADSPLAGTSVPRAAAVGATGAEGTPVMSATPSADRPPPLRGASGSALNPPVAAGSSNGCLPPKDGAATAVAPKPKKSFNMKDVDKDAPQPRASLDQKRPATFAVPAAPAASVAGAAAGSAAAVAPAVTHLPSSTPSNTPVSRTSIDSTSRPSMDCAVRAGTETALPGTDALEALEPGALRQMVTKLKGELDAALRSNAALQKDKKLLEARLKTVQLRLDLKQAEREEQEIENNDVDVPSAQVSEDMVHGTPSAPSVAAASPALTPGLAPQDAAIGGRVPHMLPPGEPDASAATAAAASAVDRGLVAAMQGAVDGGGS